MISDLNLPVPIKTTAKHIYAARTSSAAMSFFTAAANLNGAIIYGLNAVFSINHQNLGLGIYDGTDSFIEIGNGSVYIPVKREISISSIGYNPNSTVSGAAGKQESFYQREILTLERPVFLPAGVGFGIGVYPNNLSGATVSSKTFVNYELL